VGGHREEMRPALPLDAVQVDEHQVRLVDERGRLERVIAPLALEEAVGQAPQLPVDQWQELLCGGGMARIEIAQELRDLVLR
jgi:hypothetical protein